MVRESLGGETGPGEVAGGRCGPTRALRPRWRRRTTVGVLGAVAVALGVVLVLGLIVPSVGRPAVPGPSPDRSGASSDLLCNGVYLRTTHLAVFLSGCQALFWVEYAENFSQAENTTNQYNFSFAIPWISEVTSAGALVRLASALAPLASTVNLTYLPGEVILSSLETLNVTNASGNWTPNDTWFGTGTAWNISNRTVGTVSVGVDFYLFNTSADSDANTTENTSLSVEFDVTVTGWPWASSTDLLGFGLDSLGAEGSHFVFNQTSRTLQEEWNSTNLTFASLLFGTVANVSYPDDHLGQATVTEQAGVYNAGTPSRESMVLATFGAVTGGYSFLVYDPWVVFSPSGTTIPPHLGPPALAGGIPPWAPLALALAAVTTGLALIGTYVVRNSVLRREGMELVNGMREAMSRVPPPDRPK